MCSDRSCRCLVNSRWYTDAMQLCAGERIPCLYICQACRSLELRAISYGRDVVTTELFYDGTRRKPQALRLMNEGDVFEWLYVGFRNKSVTIRKVLKPALLTVRDGPIAILRATGLQLKQELN